MVEFAMGGLCNCCLDKLNKSYIVENGGVELTVKCLSRSVSVQVSLSNTQCLCVPAKGLFSSSCEETVLSAVTTLMFLTTPDTKKGKPLAKQPLTASSSSSSPFPLLLFLPLSPPPANNDLLVCLIVMIL